MIQKFVRLVPSKNIDPKRAKNLRRAYLWSLIVSLIGCIFALTPRLNPNLYTMIVFSPIFPMAKEVFEGGALAGAEPLTIKSKDGPLLRAWFFKAYGAKQGNKTVLVCHGKSANMMYNLDFVKYFREHFSANVMLFDYRGHGYSTGFPSIAGICDDSLAAFDYLTQEKHIDANDIVVVGESLGSIPACQILKNRKCAGVVVNAGFSSLSRKAKEVIPLFGMFPEWFLSWDDRVNNELAVNGDHSPLIIVHGSIDHMFNVDTHARVLYKAASEPKKLLVFDGIGHSREFLMTKRYLDTLRPLFKPSEDFMAVTDDTNAH